ncbi:MULTISPECIES: hypothetical protein [unclassified Streptomyces]|uniref:hypothetical protein n=1 Tax=Streptomyces TaxID=1883 RepID=UPI00136EEF52|nr:MULTISPECIES: hypothetical protein [unclassified Streptomyces]NEA01326.1 hypothetical protein [Streptomyces sp. SID10116]MYY83939.1 hypothetical protein [Streptomyces sp. SID335]MYZ16175.1 hypothetical protein [Streptomyces sp. SID337]NDZ84141.1 hypothetical protein [Streptomyces sp. SID10115]NEB44650.1 hypothetical protein [Streptomyces sp. SID339]
MRSRHVARSTRLAPAAVTEETQAGSRLSLIAKAEPGISGRRPADAPADALLRLTSCTD